MSSPRLRRTKQTSEALQDGYDKSILLRLEALSPRNSVTVVTGRIQEAPSTCRHVPVWSNAGAKSPWRAPRQTVGPAFARLVRVAYHDTGSPAARVRQPNERDQYQEQRGGAIEQFIGRQGVRLYVDQSIHQCQDLIGAQPLRL